MRMIGGGGGGGGGECVCKEHKNKTLKRRGIVNSEVISVLTEKNLEKGRTDKWWYREQDIQHNISINQFKLSSAFCVCIVY